MFSFIQFEEYTHTDRERDTQRHNREQIIIDKNLKRKKKNNNIYLPFDGKGKPSKFQAICGDGFPAAEHFNETAGPGCNVCSIKLYIRTGGASENLIIIKKKNFNKIQVALLLLEKKNIV